MARLKDKYTNEIVPKLLKENKYSSIMEVPRMSKITINMGVGEAVENAKALEAAVDDIGNRSQAARYQGQEEHLEF